MGLTATSVSPWLTGIAAATLALGFICAMCVVVDIYVRGHRQKMRVMELVWPITGLYLGPFAIAGYWRWGRTNSARDGVPRSEPAWVSAAVGASHCGAGCALGDVLGAWIVFATGATLAGIALFPEYGADLVIAYILGIAFQYFAIAPMRRLGRAEGLRAAVKADTLSLAAFEVGMFGWMAVVQLVIFGTSHLAPDHLAYWFFMQIAMILGFVTALPVNAWLIRRGIKEAM